MLAVVTLENGTLRFHDNVDPASAPNIFPEHKIRQHFVVLCLDDCSFDCMAKDKKSAVVAQIYQKSSLEDVILQSGDPCFGVDARVHIWSFGKAFGEPDDKFRLRQTIEGWIAEECGKEFTSHYTRKETWITPRSSRSTNNNLLYGCPHCSRTFANFLHFYLHVNKHHFVMLFFRKASGDPIEQR